MKRLIVACVLAVGSTAMAGDFTANGEGHVGSPTDFVSVRVDVVSQCYGTSSEASAANTGLATEISKAMKSVTAENGKDEVLVNQGVTQKMTINEYNNRGETTKVCEGWSASSSVQLKLADLKAWPGLQDNLTKLIDDAAAKGDAKSAKTIAKIASVQPALLPETAKRDAEAAYVIALNDAREKMNITLKTYGLCFVGYKSVTPETGYAIPYGASRESSPAPAAPGGGVGGQGVELSLGLQYTHSSVAVIFDAISCSEQK